METFAQVLGASRRIEIEGKQYTLSLITFEDIAELRMRILARKMDRVKALLETPQDRAAFARQLSHEIYTDAEFQAELLLTLEGQIDLLELSLRHEHKDITTAAVGQLLIGKNRKQFEREIAQVFMDSMGPMGVSSGEDEQRPDPPEESPSSPPQPS